MIFLINRILSSVDKTSRNSINLTTSTNIGDNKRNILKLVSELVLESPMLMILGDFKPPEWELSQDFMAAITTMGLTL